MPVSLTYKLRPTIPLSLSSHPIPSAAIHFHIYLHHRDRRIRRPTKKSQGVPSDLSRLTMVVALGPGRFYGSGLPRPRVFPGDRVDPPVPVTDALLCWAREAHWSMGGLGDKRLRLQGRIEGNLVKLRRTARRDARVSAKARSAGEKPASLDPLGSDDDDESDKEEVEAQERALRLEVVDEEEESDDSSDSDEEEVALVAIAAAAKRKRARKLVDEFDRIAPQKKKQKTAAVTPARASPKRKAAAAPAPAPAAAAPVKTSLKKKTDVAKNSPKRKAAEAPAARRTSPRAKH